MLHWVIGNYLSSLVDSNLHLWEWSGSTTRVDSNLLGSVNRDWLASWLGLVRGPESRAKSNGVLHELVLVKCYIEYSATILVAVFISSGSEVGVRPESLMVSQPGLIALVTGTRQSSWVTRDKWRCIACVWSELLLDWSFCMVEVDSMLGKSPDMSIFSRDWLIPNKVSSEEESELSNWSNR